MTADAEVASVRSVFLKLRTRAGLTVERLRVTTLDTAVLRSLPAVKRRMTDSDLDEDEAIVDTVASFVGELTPPDRLIADVVLALEVLRDDLGELAQIDNLYASDLGDRREALVACWAEALRLLHVTDVPPAPIVRSLRGSREEETLERLAERCVRSVDHGIVMPTMPPSQRSNSVVVVGSAVKDHVLVVDSLPAAGTSVQATAYEVNPGGKGLSLAVAGSRMGLNVGLATAVGDDRDGNDLIDFMRAEGLTTEYVRQVPGETTPVAQVIVLPNGDAAAIGWKNDLRVAISTRDLRKTHAAIQVADAVLVTLEVPIDVVKWTLDKANRQSKRPVVLLQASPPLAQPHQIYGQLSAVDYIVGSEWALRMLLSDENQEQTVDEIARKLMIMGVTTVCVVDNMRCRIRSNGLNADISAPEVALADAPGSREAFSAALIHHLLKGGRDLTRETLQWACNAMAANLSLEFITDSMPNLDEVERVAELSNS